MEASQLATGSGTRACVKYDRFAHIYENRPFIAQMSRAARHGTLPDESSATALGCLRVLCRVRYYYICFFRSQFYTYIIVFLVRYVVKLCSKRELYIYVGCFRITCQLRYVILKKHTL